jgi:hypothetical protein
MLGFAKLLFLLLLNNIGNLTAGAVILDVDRHAADFGELICVCIHFGSDLGFTFLEFDKVFDLNWFDFHFFLACKDLSDKLFGS